MKAIEKIEEEQKALSEELANLSELKTIMSEDSFIQMVNEMYQEFFSEVGDYPDELVLDEIDVIADKKIRLNSLISRSYFAEYEDIADKINSIVYGTEVAWETKVEREYMGFTFYIKDYVVAKLPEQEINLLKKLGKIKTEFNEASISSSIFCEIIA